MKPLGSTLLPGESLTIGRAVIRAPGEATARHNKYRNRPTEVDGIRFASMAEARRYGELKMMERQKQIRELKLQPRYPMVVNGLPICTYVGDFEYMGAAGYVTEDTKGMQTPLFKLKAKLFRALYPQITLLLSR